METFWRAQNVNNEVKTRWHGGKRKAHRNSNMDGFTFVALEFLYKTIAPDSINSVLPELLNMQFYLTSNEKNAKLRSHEN